MLSYYYILFIFILLYTFALASLDGGSRLKLQVAVLEANMSKGFLLCSSEVATVGHSKTVRIVTSKDQGSFELFEVLGSAWISLSDGDLTPQTTKKITIRL